ncbi:BSD-domain-containing protein, partial [Hortaea werneckii]
GGWFNQARKQGEAYLTDLQKEAQDVQGQATQGWSKLQEEVTNRTRGLSLNAEPAPASSVPGEEAVPSIKTTEPEKEKQPAEHPEKPESLPADIVKEAGSLVASLRTTAAAKLKDLQKAEDAADEALLKFGSNVRNFLRDAVVITAPTDADSSKPKGTDAAGNEVLFETTESGTGKKVFHTTRLDAQLHAIHTTASSFTQDPSQGAEWDEWTKNFDIDKQTEAIAQDLEKYEELRRAMEKLVPEKVEYKLFWTRYYFLRKAVEADERRRKEVLKGAAAQPEEEEVGWGSDNEDESTTPNPKSTKPTNDSSTTLNATAGSSSNDLLKPKEPRRSTDDKSVADSDASYDIVSGATSRAAGSPKEEKKEKSEASDDDWE